MIFFQIMIYERLTIPFNHDQNSEFGWQLWRVVSDAWHGLRVRFNARYLWIALHWIHKLMDSVGLDLQRWTRVHCPTLAVPFLHSSACQSLLMLLAG